MVAQKFKILLEKEKRLVRGSALVNLSDTKQGFTVPREKQSVWRLGYATFKFVNFVRVYCTCLYYQFNSFNSTLFFLEHSF